MSKRIVITGGGTGGHLSPLIAVTDYIKEKYWQQADIEFLFLGPDTQMERDMMSSHEIPHKKIVSGKLRRYFSFRYFIDIFKLPIGFFQALWHLLVFMPDVVFAKGGFASVPVVVAARLYRIPVLLHESDAFPGVANRFLGSIASKVAITFERARMYFPPSDTTLTGVPVRAEILSGSRENGIKLLKLRTESKPIILFLGGSLGAKIINDTVVDSISGLLEHYQVVHLTGKAHYRIIVDAIEIKGYKIEHSDYYPLDFVSSEMKDILAMADIVVSRAGATFISEIAANKKPAILVPISKSANNHQRINAYEVAKAGGAIVLEESNFKRSLLLRTLKDVLFDEDLKKKLSDNIAKFYHPDATENIANELVKLANLELKNK